MEQKPKQDTAWRSGMAMVGIAFSIPSSFGGPIFIGYLLDKEYNSSPTCLLVGLFLGAFSVIVSIRVLIRKMNSMK